MLSASVIFAGDCNAGPHEGIYDLLAKGAIDASHQDWVRGSCFEWGRLGARSAQRGVGLSRMQAMTLTHPFKLTRSATVEGYSYIKLDNRVSLIDHIVYDSSLLSVRA